MTDEERREKRREYYRGHKKEFAASQLKWQRAHREEVRAYQKAYREANPDKVKQWQENHARSILRKLEEQKGE